MSTEPIYPTTGPHLSLVATDEAVQRADNVAGVAETYTRMADELAAMVEAEADRSARTYAVLADALGELHTALDELAGRGAEL